MTLQDRFLEISPERENPSSTSAGTPSTMSASTHFLHPAWSQTPMSGWMSLGGTPRKSRTPPPARGAFTSWTSQPGSSPARPDVRGGCVRLRREQPDALELRALVDDQFGDCDGLPPPRLPSQRAGRLVGGRGLPALGLRCTSPGTDIPSTVSPQYQAVDSGGETADAAAGIAGRVDPPDGRHAHAHLCGRRVQRCRGRPAGPP